MQAASCFVQPIFPSKSAIFTNCPSNTTTHLTTNRTSPIKASASPAFEPLSFNYNSSFSVFPAEACDVVGGNACTAVMFPETKLETPKIKSSESNRYAITEQVDREYFDYNSDPRSVLREEACDDLGGEFCLVKLSCTCFYVAPC